MHRSLLLESTLRTVLAATICSCAPVEQPPALVPEASRVVEPADTIAAIVPTAVEERRTPALGPSASDGLQHLTGSVVDPSGRGVAGARVEAFLVGDGRESWTIAPDGASVGAVTDAAGVFVLGPLPVGPVHLVARQPRFVPCGVMSSGTGCVEMTLDPLDGVFGRVEAVGGQAPPVVVRTWLEVSPRGRDGPWQRIGEPYGVETEEARRGEFRAFGRSRRPVRVVVEFRDGTRAASGPFRLERCGTVGPITLRIDAGSVP